MAVATYSAVNVVGLPEAAENLAQLVLYLGECLRWAALLSKGHSLKWIAAESPKDTRAYRAWKKAAKAVKEAPSVSVVNHAIGATHPY